MAGAQGARGDRSGRWASPARGELCGRGDGISQGGRQGGKLPDLIYTLKMCSWCPGTPLGLLQVTLSLRLLHFSPCLLTWTFPGPTPSSPLDAAHLPVFFNHSSSSETPTRGPPLTSAHAAPSVSSWPVC